MFQIRSRRDCALSLLVTLLFIAGCKDNPGGIADGSSAADGSTPVTAGGNTANTSGGSTPQLSGSPRPAVKVGETYTFTPTVSGSTGNNLKFYLENRPSWMGFSPQSGRISGTPGPGDIGSYRNIRVAVSDGSTTTALPSFSVEVTQTASGSATVSWVPPTENTDGSPLTDLAAYKIYYGFSEGDYTREIRIDNPGLTTYVVDNLSPATYFFATTSINSNGVESEHSNVGMKTIN